MTRRLIGAFLLAATAATPLLAQDQGYVRWQDRGKSDQDKQEAKPAPQAQRQAPQAQVQPPARSGGDFRGGGDHGSRGTVHPQAQAIAPQAQSQARGDSNHGSGSPANRNDAFDHRTPYDQRSPYAQGSPYDHQSAQHDWHGQPGANDQRGGWNGHPDWSDHRGNDGNHGGWNGNWRGDNRYDWHGWRDSHHDLFRGPRYYAPHGWSYRRFSPGYRLEPFLFSQQYWIDDPWDYRLPPADGPYRWVRYYDDVLLVDLRSGVVVDVIPSFFY
jgi:Ni/Co efflux regulator RcnB